MTTGANETKYDNACMAARTLTGGGTVLLIVLNGTKGSGFSIKSDRPSDVFLAPDVLRRIADMIDRPDQIEEIICGSHC